MYKKKLKIYILLQAVTILFTGVTLLAANYLLPNVTPEMNTADYWIAKQGLTEAQIMTAARIAEVNAETFLRLPGIMVNLTTIPSQMPPDTISQWIQSPSFPKGLHYTNGQPLPADFFEKIRFAMNLNGITGKTEYGITLCRAAIRTFPTDCPIFDTPDDREFDNLQETIVNPGEAVVILHQSADRQWSYIQTSYYRGWTASANIGVTSSKTEWAAFQNPSEFLIVIDPNFSIKNSSHPGAPTLFYEMGARIPLAPSRGTDPKTYSIIIPGQTLEGKLSAKTISIPASTGLHYGYLPCTRSGLVRQAFKMLGARYGWGGMFQSVDCSSFIMDIYRCFGIILPRNTGEQECSGLTPVDFSRADTVARHQLISELPAGSLLYLKGHVMFYLGTVGGRHYVIHALAAYGRPTGTTGQYQRINVMQVTVSDLDLPRASGKTLLESLVVGKAL